MERLTRRSKVGEGLPIKHMNLIHMDTTSEDTLTEMLDKLADYEDTEEQGLLIKLPCKVGDTVYEANIGRKMISTYKVTSIVIMTGSRNYGWELIDGIYSNLYGFNEYALGKTVFLTREEAEKALKKQGE